MTVRMAGHHAIWLPTAKDELAVLDRIFGLIETMPAARIARTLTAEGVPPPAAGRRGTNGVWHRTTVRNILRNATYIALREYGKRSEGDQLRFTPEGPRPLDESDYGPGGRERRVANPPERRIVTPQRFDPVVDQDRFDRAQRVLDARRCRRRRTPE